MIIQTWMLTGDKMETAICIATSAKLVSKDHAIHCFPEVGVLLRCYGVDDFLCNK